LKTIKTHSKINLLLCKRLSFELYKKQIIQLTTTSQVFESSSINLGIIQLNLKAF